MTKKNSPGKILLVDDEADFRQAASRALTRQGFEMAEAESGERAIEMVRESAPDIVLLDLRMPGIDGITTLLEMRKILPDLPVIILTGHGQFSDAMAGIRFDVVDFVQKPVDLNRLGALLREFLAGERKLPLREKSIVDLMVPVDGCARVYIDQPLQQIVRALSESDDSSSPDGSDPHHGTLLVFDRQEKYVGLIRARDVVWMMVPAFLKDSPYSSYFTGMFLAQTKIMGKQPIQSLIRKRKAVELGAPLMEAVHAMAVDRVGVLPVMHDGRLVGLLHAEELFKQVAFSIAGS